MRPQFAFLLLLTTESLTRRRRAASYGLADSLLRVLEQETSMLAKAR